MAGVDSFSEWNESTCTDSHLQVCSHSLSKWKANRQTTVFYDSLIYDFSVNSKATLLINPSVVCSACYLHRYLGGSLLCVVSQDKELRIDIYT